MILKNILFVMLGGAAGSTLRYLVQVGCHRLHWTTLPLGTLVVNIVGCFLLGLLLGVSERCVHFSEATFMMLTVGLCGAFTTFSTFSADTIRMMENGQWWVALGYLTTSVVVGFLLFYLGKRILFLG